MQFGKEGTVYDSSCFVSSVRVSMLVSVRIPVRVPVRVPLRVLVRDPVRIPALSALLQLLAIVQKRAP